MNKTNIIGPLPVAQPGKPMQPSAHSATSRIKWAVALRMPKPLPLGEPFGYTSTPFYHTFPLATRLNGRKNSQNGQKSRKNACKALCRRPSEPKNTGGKTPESPKIPLQLGCSVTQIRHFFKRTFFNLPLIFENNVKKATVWLHERGETYRFRKASPSGSNNDDRRQWRKQGGAVGAAASRMRATAKQTLGAATRAVSPKVTERARMLTVI